MKIMRRADRRLAVVLAGTALTVGAAMPGAAATAGASVAASPGWRVVRYFGACDSAGVTSVTALGVRDAWATGEAFGFQCDSPGLLIAHWDGHSWRDLPPPPGFRFSDLRESIGHSVAILSPSYSWTFVDQGDPQLPADAESFALQYRAGHWQTFRLANGTTVNSAAVFSPSNAWAFGTKISDLNAFPFPYAVHFDGRSWRRVVMPVQPLGTAAPTPRSIWAVGFPPADRGQFPQTFELAHWTGRWRLIPFPTGIASPGESFVDARVVPAGQEGAWIAATLAKKVAGQVSVVGLVLLNWTGRRWTHVDVPFTSAGLSAFSSGGRGGLWIASMPSASCLGCDNVEMIHYQSGTWSATSPRVSGLSVTAMRLIPGTNSVWASGSALSPDGEGDTVGVMMKFGP